MNFSPKECNVYILYDRGVPRSENDIYTIRVKIAGKKERIGYIFPLQALMSTQHAYVTSRIFQKYAYVAYYLLLENISEQREIRISGDGNFRLTDYYIENKGINIFVFDTEKINDQSLCDIRLFYPSLYKYGYVVDEKNYKEKWSLDESVKQQKDLLFYPISNNIVRCIPNIFDIFRSTCKVNSDLEYAKFYNNYQFIEIFLYVIFKEILGEKLTSYNGNTSIDPYDFRVKISKDTSEKERIKKIFQKDIISNISKKNLMQLCNDFLREYNTNEETDVGCALYSVRNLLVHRLYNIDLSDAKGLLKNLNGKFNEIILELLVKYS